MPGAPGGRRAFNDPTRWAFLVSLSNSREMNHTEIGRPLFHMRQADAAAKLGIAPTTLKHACRKLGVGRWPWQESRRTGNRSKPDVNPMSQSGAMEPPAWKLGPFAPKRVEDAQPLQTRSLAGAGCSEGDHDRPITRTQTFDTVPFHQSHQHSASLPCDEPHATARPAKSGPSEGAHTGRISQAPTFDAVPVPFQGHRHMVSLPYVEHCATERPAEPDPDWARRSASGRAAELLPRRRADLWQAVDSNYRGLLEEALNCV